jgi:hypothetical protein
VVVVSGAVEAPGGYGDLDKVQQVSANSGAWSARTGVSRSEAEEWLELLQTPVPSGRGSSRRFTARLIKRKMSVGARAQGERGGARHGRQGHLDSLDLGGDARRYCELR